MDQDRWARKQARWEARMARRQFRGSGGIVFGAMVILAGAAILLDNLGVLNVAQLWRYWPVVLIGVGVAKVLECQAVGALVWGGIEIVAGALLLADTLGYLRFDWRVVWPLAIIAFGIKVLLGSLERSGGVAMPYSSSSDASSDVMVVSIFGGNRRRVATQDFRGGEIIAVFGGCYLDLRNAGIAGGRAVLDINAAFGGVEVVVPPTWHVDIKAFGIFGAFEDKTLPPPPSDVPAPELVVTGAAAFGGCVVMNAKEFN